MPAMLIPLLTALIPLLPSLAGQVTSLIGELTGKDEITPEARRMIDDLAVAMTEEARRREAAHLAEHPATS